MAAMLLLKFIVFSFCTQIFGGKVFFGSVVQRREGLSDVPVPQGESVKLLLLGVRLVLVVLLVLTEVLNRR